MLVTMKMKHLLLASVMTSALSCQSPRDVRHDSFDDYPVCEGKWEEMRYSPVATEFALWAPTAQQVRVLLYEEATGGVAYKMVDMQPAAQGMWKATIEGDLKHTYYVFNVKIDDVWQGDTPGVMAKAVGVNGLRAAVIDLETTNPQGWDQDRRPDFKRKADAVIYELHYRDFSMDSVSGMAHKGKFLALTERGTCMATGEKTGIDHLLELGVTHVHVQPSADFSSVDESDLSRPQYNWGYDPLNYNVPEGSYATDPFRPEVRIKEFKEMVLALHRAGLRVVMDVVYNHTAQTRGSNFERTVPGYFYRKNEKGEFSNASGCGNETASERAMVRKFMVESLRYWVEEYHIDGFRFDLMGIHDLKTMQVIRDELHKIDPTLLLYGEGWTADVSVCPEEQRALKKNMVQLDGISAFGDEFRDGLRGAWADDKAGAFLAGLPGFEPMVKMGIVGAIEHPQLTDSLLPARWAGQPDQMISYVSCHDDLCLADRLRATLPYVSVPEMVALQKLAFTAVLTAQGVPFLYAGDEMLRSKKGVRNAYNAPDEVNTINWKNKVTYKELFDYVRQLVALRKAHPCFRLGDRDKVIEALEFLETPKNVVAFRIKGKAEGDSWSNVIVVLNARREIVKLTVPEGVYQVVCKDGQVDAVAGLGTVQGAQLSVSPRSAVIMHQ